MEKGRIDGRRNRKSSGDRDSIREGRAIQIWPNRHEYERTLRDLLNVPSQYREKRHRTSTVN
jgi:hypothetical protein